jgi:hypothetical protein
VQWAFARMVGIRSMSRSASSLETAILVNTLLLATGVEITQKHPCGVVLRIVSRECEIVRANRHHGLVHECQRMAALMGVNVPLRSGTPSGGDWQLERVRLRGPVRDDPKDLV